MSAALSRSKTPLWRFAALFQAGAPPPSLPFQCLGPAARTTASTASETSTALAAATTATISTTSTTRSTNTEEGADSTIDEVRARIFGNHIGDGLRSGRKVLRRTLIGDKLTSYYPESWFSGDPLLVEVEAERKKAKLQRLSRRGKAPPKKGSGKRAGKK